MTAAKDGAAVLCQRIQSTVAQTVFTYDDARIPVRVSIGFAVAKKGSATDYDRLKRQAAQALAKAKGAGGNRWEVNGG